MLGIRILAELRPATPTSIDLLLIQDLYFIRRYSHSTEVAVSSGLHRQHLETQDYTTCGDAAPVLQGVHRNTVIELEPPPPPPLPSSSPFQWLFPPQVSSPAFPSSPFQWLCPPQVSSPVVQWTPLHNAAMSGINPECRKLVGAGAKVDAEDTVSCLLLLFLFVRSIWC